MLFYCKERCYAATILSTLYNPESYTAIDSSERIIWQAMWLAEYYMEKDT